ncbi:MAG: HlyD family secretion protein [bacterium]|nr:HlyD family secretion protein [bacterium]
MSTEQKASAARKIKPVHIAGAASIIALALGSYFLFFQTDSVSTDNAYINGPVVDITTQVSGQVAQVAVEDNQSVKAGDLLLQIDPRPFQITLDQAMANLALARQSVNQGSAGIQAAEADVLQNRSQLTQEKSDTARVHEMVVKGYLSKADMEKADTRVKSTEAELQSSEAKLTQARAQLGHTGDENESVKAAQAAVEAAQLKLDLTRITAPFSGTVSNLSLQPGSMVQAGLPLFALIGDKQVWVDANFKETQFKKLRPGLKAEIYIDMYPGRIFHGVVNSISSGSGTAFSLMPPQNATGNWVKVTQRVPVKIVITDTDPKMPLRIGISADVKVLLD